MKKKFYSIGSLVCAGLLAIFGFGSCKSGKALEQECARLSAERDSLELRVKTLGKEIKDMEGRIQDLRDGMHLTMYGGPNMSEAERQQMINAVKQKEEQARKDLEKAQQQADQLNNEYNKTLIKFNDTCDKLQQLNNKK